MREVEGYFTVEAALIFPIVLWIHLMLIYMMLFQYNRCLLEQDMGILAFRGATMNVETKEELLLGIKEQANAIYLDKYVMFQKSSSHIVLKGNSVRVSGEGNILADKSSLAALFLKTSASYEMQTISPKLFIRTVQGLKE